MTEKVLQFWSSKPYWARGSTIFGIAYILSVFLLWVFTQDIELAVTIPAFPFAFVAFIFFLAFKVPISDPTPWYAAYLFFVVGLIAWLIVGAIVGQVVKELKSGRKYNALGIILSVIFLIALFAYYLFNP